MCPLMVAKGDSSSSPVLFPTGDRQTRLPSPGAYVRHIDVIAGIHRMAIG